MSAPLRNELMPVRNSIERFFFAWFFVLIPAVYTLRLAAQYAWTGSLPYALVDLPKIASELAFLIGLTLASMFLSTISPTIASLFANGVVSRQTGEHGGVLATQVTCEQAIDRLLNHGARILIAASVAIATLSYYLTKMDVLSNLEQAESIWRVLDVVLYFVPTVCYAYFVGIVIWKLLVTSLFFQSFPERYGIAPRFLHPDGACGLLPLGDLCLRMMYVAVVPTVLSGLFLFSYFVGTPEVLIPNATLLKGFTPVILGVGVIGLLIGFIPLFRFHVAVIKHRQELTEQFTALAERIIAEKARMLRPPEDAGGPPIDTVLKTLTDLQSRYEESRKIRMWPVDGGLVARIWGSVILLTGQVVAFIEIYRKVVTPLGT